jgi:hypothetical protein
MKQSASITRLFRLCRQVETVEQRLLCGTPKPKPADFRRYATLRADYVGLYRRILDAAGRRPRGITK